LSGYFVAEEPAYTPTPPLRPPLLPRKKDLVTVPVAAEREIAALELNENVQFVTVVFAEA